MIVGTFTLTFLVVLAAFLIQDEAVYKAPRHRRWSALGSY